jgi:hypothetical protein
VVDRFQTHSSIRAKRPVKKRCNNAQNEKMSRTSTKQRQCRWFPFRDFTECLCDRTRCVKRLFIVVASQRKWRALIFIMVQARALSELDVFKGITNAWRFVVRSFNSGQEVIGGLSTRRNRAGPRSGPLRYPQHRSSLCGSPFPGNCVPLCQALPPLTQRSAYFHRGFDAIPAENHLVPPLFAVSTNNPRRP